APQREQKFSSRRRPTFRLNITVPGTRDRNSAESFIAVKMSSTMDAVTAFAPATVSNVACGFDVLGFALESPGDEVTARFAPAGVFIDDIVGDSGRLPRDPNRNTASVA